MSQKHHTCVVSCPYHSISCLHAFSSVVPSHWNTSSSSSSYCFIYPLKYQLLQEASLLFHHHLISSPTHLLLLLPLHSRRQHSTVIHIISWRCIYASLEFYVCQANLKVTTYFFSGIDLTIQMTST